MNITFENMKETLGERLFSSLKSIKQQTKLVHTLFGYFLRFYEQRNKFNDLFKKN